MMRKILLCLLLFSVNLSGFPEEPKKWIHSYTHRYYGIREGLAQMQVFQSFQDSCGYLWFSTNEGVSRFDGSQFETFSHQELHISARIRYFLQYESAVVLVAGAMIVFVYPDRTMEYYPLPDTCRGVLISEIVVTGDNIYLFNGINPAQPSLKNHKIIRFDLKTKTFVQFAEYSSYLKPFVSGQKIYAITAHEIKNQQLTLYRIDNDQLKAIQTVRMGEQDLYLSFSITKQNDCFAVIYNGLVQQLYRCFVEGDSLRWDYLVSMEKDVEVIDIEQLDEHRFFVGTIAHPSFILDMEKRSLSPFPLNTLMAHDVLVDRTGNLWLSTEEGLYQCSRYLFESFQLGLGRSDNTWSVIKDSHGNVWFSSFSFGFHRVDKQGNVYRPKTIYQHKDFSVPRGYMSNCADSRGRVYQTHWDGIAVFDPQQSDSNRLDIIKAGASLIVYHDAETGNICFGGETDSCRTLNILHPNGKLSTFPFDYRYIVSISHDGNRNLRIGTFRGEARLDEVNQVIVPDTVQRPYQGIVSMDLDEQGILWKGTTDGLFAEDRQGNDRQLSDHTVSFVLHYKNQYIIWGARDKLYLLDLPAYHRDTTVHIRTFGYYDGFDLIECGQNGASIDPEGYVWVAGSDKAIRFLPEQIMEIPPLQPQTPYLAAIYNADKNSGWRQVFANRSFSDATQAPREQSEEIQLANKDNYLRFDLLQASVSAPDQLMFRYRLNGYNEQWTTSRDRSPVFQNLPFGKYRLEVQSSVDDGLQWSESIFSPLAIIRKPFLLTTPGLLLLSLLFGGLTVIFIYYTRKISIRKAQEIQKIDRLKHRAIQAKFIPHFTGNVLNSINYLISKNPDSARKYISKFNDFSNQTLRHSDNLYRSIAEELEYSRLYLELEKLRFEEKLTYTITVAPEVDTQKTIPTMILQTFCENAIKHGLWPKAGGGKIAISVYMEAGSMILVVEDDGIGREKARLFKTEGSQEGLKIVQQQLDIFNRNQAKKAFLKIIDLSDKEGQPSGTRFELHI